MFYICGYLIGGDLAIVTF
jgi:hypothetical protein